MIMSREHDWDDNEAIYSKDFLEQVAIKQLLWETFRTDIIKLLFSHAFLFSSHLQALFVPNLASRFFLRFNQLRLLVVVADAEFETKSKTKSKTKTKTRTRLREAGTPHKSNHAANICWLIRALCLPLLQLLTREDNRVASLRQCVMIARRRGVILAHSSQVKQAQWLECFRQIIELVSCSAFMSMASR